MKFFNSFFYVHFTVSYGNRQGLLLIIDYFFVDNLVQSTVNANSLSGI